MPIKEPWGSDIRRPNHADLKLKRSPDSISTDAGGGERGCTVGGKVKEACLGSAKALSGSEGKRGATGCEAAA